MKCELNDRMIIAIQRLKDAALKYGGNAMLQDAVDVQVWLQNSAGDAALPKTDSEEDEKEEKT